MIPHASRRSMLKLNVTRVSADPTAIDLLRVSAARCPELGRQVAAAPCNHGGHERATRKV
jgi:hypothetical protein